MLGYDMARYGHEPYRNYFPLIPCSRHYRDSASDGMCHSEYGRAQLCRPDFHDLAYEKNVHVSHTCGFPPRRFCRPNLRGQTCDVCDGRDAMRAHPAKFLTDLHNENNVTCWVADPVQSRENVTLTLSLGKTYDITYVSVQFCSIRPESMAIYKSMDFGKTWQPYQFYSGDCENMYERPVNGYVGEENEQEALCTDGHLIRPHHGGRIAFSTLAACNCNLHSRSCELNMELFGMTGGRSGGVCVNCRHNTAGRYCHYCKEGYFKDPNKPSTHRKTCRLCNCHPYGSRGRVCNQITGQCPCKEGVTGRSCDKCAKGYNSTKSSIVPCIGKYLIRDSSHLSLTIQPQRPPVKAKDFGCSQCRHVPLRAKRFCRRDYAMKVTVVRVDKNSPKEWVRVTVNINTSFKRSALRFRRGDGYLWIRLRDHKCKCPRLKRGHSYFIAGKIRRNRLRRSIIVDGRSIVVPWTDKLLKRIYKFKKLQRKNKCR
ncbi:hypothetical protein QZH41_013141 [Actinostola sp. cb2023]|nr:hypothetical protein QZH41_013141 [Actinostola sp. cb2023]